MPDSHSGADNFQVTRQGVISMSTRITTSASVNLLLHTCGSTRGLTVRKAVSGKTLLVRRHIGDANWIDVARDYYPHLALPEKLNAIVFGNEQIAMLTRSTLTKLSGIEAIYFLPASQTYFLCKPMRCPGTRSSKV
jgi:hypothetical protein